MSERDKGESLGVDDLVCEWERWSVALDAVRALRERIHVRMDKGLHHVTFEGAELDTILAALDARLKAPEAEIEQLRTLVQVMLDNDPNDMAADGVTVLDVWRQEARRVQERK